MNKEVPKGAKLLSEFLDEFEKSLPWYIRFVYIPYVRFRIILKRTKK